MLESRTDVGKPIFSGVIIFMQMIGRALVSYSAKSLGMRRRGFTVLEVVIALALTGLIIPAVLGALSATSKLTDDSYDRTVMFGLAQSELEDVQGQPFQNSPASYSLISVPTGYSIAVTTTPAVPYTYPAPSSSPSSEIVQQVTVTVTGVHGNLTMVGYKSK